MADQMTEEQKAKLEAEQKAKLEAEQKAKAKGTSGFSPLMTEAMSAYGIRPEHIMGATDRKDRVVIVTRGGRKVSFAPGDKVVKLSKVDLDGKMPEHVRAAKEAAKKRGKR